MSVGRGVGEKERKEERERESEIESVCLLVYYRISIFLVFIVDFVFKLVDVGGEVLLVEAAPHCHPQSLDSCLSKEKVLKMWISICHKPRSPLVK